MNVFSLIWMCHNRTTNRKINKLHEGCLRIIYNDKQSSFKKFLENIVLSPFTIELLNKYIK